MKEAFGQLIPNIVSTLSLLLAFVIYRSATKSKRETKIAEEAVFKEAMLELKKKFEKETGGNSGGMREAINGISERQKEIKTTLTDEARKSEVISGMVHELAGSLRQLNLSQGNKE